MESVGSREIILIPSRRFYLQRSQMMFAIITPALITGAVAGRMKFKALFIFIALWSIVVYYPMAHMVWGSGGFLAEIGSVDFAGGNVVHISSVYPAWYWLSFSESVPVTSRFRFVRTMFRLSFSAHSCSGSDGSDLMRAVRWQPTALPFTLLVTTNTSAAAGLISWMLIDTIKTGKPTVIGACTGGVVGLVAITPGAGFVPIWASLIIGLLVSPICYFSVSVLKKKFGYDDALDAFGCHGIGVSGAASPQVFSPEAISIPSLSGTVSCTEISICSAHRSSVSS